MKQFKRFAVIAAAIWAVHFIAPIFYAGSPFWVAKAWQAGIGGLAGGTMHLILYYRRVSRVLCVIFTAVLVAGFVTVFLNGDIATLNFMDAVWTVLAPAWVYYAFFRLRKVTTEQAAFPQSN